MKKDQIESGGNLQKARAFNPENPLSTAAQDSKSDLLLNCRLISALPMKSKDNFSSIIRRLLRVF